MSRYYEIAKRRNNNKRGFLLVNPFLGKHIPVSPSEVLSMFDKVVDELKIDTDDNYYVLVIGFAETATALGLHYAIKNDYIYLQTTREPKHQHEDLIYFAEEHSHATAQYILKESMDIAIDSGINHIVFVDDEITTGKTILNAIAALKRVYPNACLKYDVVSILNSMDEMQMHAYENKNIGVHYLEHLDCSGFAEQVSHICKNGYYLTDAGKRNIKLPCCIGLDGIFPNPRYVLFSKYYQFRLNESLDYFIAKYADDCKDKSVLVLGWEEFMYPAICFGNRLEQVAKNVKTHAVTRSPISVSFDAEYPLQCGISLQNSAYEDGRNVYLYNVGTYDKVFIFIEYAYCFRKQNQGLMDLANMLTDLKNKDIQVICI